MFDELIKEIEKDLTLVTIVGIKECIRPGSTYLVKNL